MSAPRNDEPGEAPPSDRSRRLWDLFDQAADLPPAEQRKLLDAAGAGDPGLRAELEKLLVHDARLQADEGADFLQSPLRRSGTETPPTADSAALADALPLPAQFGHYRVLRLLGEGGMGTVYEAEQDNPRRRVALKAIRPGLVTPPLLKRFAKEAQILGRLHHPGIASVYEAGIAADGRPFFAMELIDGRPLDAYVRHRGLTAPARLELLARMCDAVQHAHVHGVIHRDLKPGNILVDDTGQPKVLDFGVAHVTDADLQTTTGRTESGQLLGTLSYMSPEQVAGDPTALDQRSDVYALGVILFELLAERLPYQLEHLPLWEVVRIIREQEPSRLGSVNAAFRGDVETIVGKALAKEKARRYASAGELAADIRRYLAHEPIRARPPSALYQLRKFTRRHKGLVGGAAATVLALVLGLVGTILFAVGEARQRHDAEHNAREANHEKHEALFQAYRARIAAAIAALSANDVADAARHLDAAPHELRDWEWWHLHSRLDDSTAMVRLRGDDRAPILSGPEGLRVGIFTDTGLRFRDESGNESSERPLAYLARSWLAVAPSPTGWWLAATEYPRITLWDETGRLRGALKPRDVVESHIALSPDRTRLAAPLYAHRGAVAIYDTSTGQERAHLVTEAGVIALAFSPDSRRLAAGGDGRVIHIWDAATGKELAHCDGHTSKILSIAFRGDGKRLLTASHDGTVRQWDAESGHEVEPPYALHTAEVAAAVYSPDGKRVASAGADHTIRLWQATGRDDQVVLRGHSGVVTDLAFSQDGRRLASASCSLPDLQGDGTVRFWEAAPEATLPILAGHDSYVYPVAYSPDGRWIASGAWDQWVRLWDAATGEECAKLKHPGILRALAFAPDSTRLVSHAETEVLVWDLFTRQIRGRVACRKAVVALAVSPDGTRIAVGTLDPKTGLTIRIVAMATGTEIGSAEGMPFAFSPDGTRLAGTDVDRKNVVLWDAQSLRPVANWPGHTQVINAIAFDRDGGRLVSASSDRTVRLWDVATGQCLRTFKGHTGEVFAAAFHPDGTRLATAGRDRAIWLWDLARGEEVARLPGHTSYVWSLAFSPDGHTLVSGSGDHTVRLWDTAPLKARYQARRHAEALQPEAERLVQRLCQQKNDPAAVVEALRADPALSQPLRDAALRLVMSGAAGR